MFAAALLGMEAAGMVFDYMGKQDQKALNEMGAEVDQAGIAANISLTRAQAEDATLQSMRTLRQTIGSQIAIQTARGTRTGAGSAATILNDSIYNFNQDRRSRSINMMSRINELNAKMTGSKLNTQAFNTGLDREFSQSLFNKIPFAAMLNGMGGGSSKYSLASASQRGAESIGFGMTSI